MAIGDKHSCESVTLSGHELAQWRAVPGMVDALRLSAKHVHTCHMPSAYHAELAISDALAAYEEA